MRWAVLAVLAGCSPTTHPGAPFDGGSTDRALQLVNDDLAVLDGGGSGDVPGVLTTDLTPGGTTDLAGCSLAAVSINEVQTHGVTASDEWVELYNRCAMPVDLSGATLAYRSATDTGSSDTRTLVTFPAGSSISGSGTLGSGWLLVANLGYVGTNADYTYSGSGLADAGGGVGLRDPSGALVDSVGWGTATNPFVETAAAPMPPVSQSIALHGDGNDRNNNSTDFTVSTPTPRAPN